MDGQEDNWSQMLDEAALRARSAGRGDVADYIALRTRNDEIRRTAVDWLFDAMREFAGEANRRHAGILVEDSDPHRFSIGTTGLEGSLLRFRQGVRCLTVEAGWTRNPSDGFMRGGALALARITHFGRAKNNAELHLVRFEDKPRWFTINPDGMKTSFEITDLVDHFRVFLGA